MFEIIDNKFHNEQYGDAEYLNNWPMLYVLENGKEAYIGQSNHVQTRMKEHKASTEKLKFKFAHFIYSEKFNQSVTMDYESRLIRYFAADQLFDITNKNEGMANKNYYKKNDYDGLFSVLWEDLRKRKLARLAIEDIENSDLFKYSPYKDLNDSQRIAVEDILNEIQKDSRIPICVYGMPGSGKTIVAIFLIKYLKDHDEFKDKKIGLVIPQTSLRGTLKKIFRNIHGLKPADVLGPYDTAKQKYDILLVDEAHRLHKYKNISNMGPHKKNNITLGLPENSDQLDWILTQSDRAILFYDENQVVGPSGIEVQTVEAKLKDKFNLRMLKYYELTTQMRVKGGDDYIQYVKDLLNAKVSKKKEFNNYEFAVINSFDHFNKLLYKQEKRYKLCRMVAGYAWKWISKKNKSAIDIKIESIEKRWNGRLDNWVNSDSAIDEVGCIHSIQGYDLNYAFVILGKDIRYNRQTGDIEIDPDCYYDRNGKATAGKEELTNYIKNIYYVLMTRGIRGTYLYVCDKDLKNYLSQYIDVY